MFKFVNYFKKNVLTVSVVAIISVAFGGAILVALNDTYAMDKHTIIFNRYEDTEIMDKCETDVNGKLEADCITQIGRVCSRWSPQSQKDGPQTEQIPSASFADMVFTEDKEYYCVAGSSQTYNTGCYECKDDKNIVHWAASGDGNAACPGGYKKIHENIDECKVYACYECKDDKNYMEWRYSALSDDNCPSGYNRTTKTQEECKPIIPDSCYVCKTDENIMKWDNNSNADKNCSSGYEPVALTQENCKPEVVPNFCYVCKDDKNVFTWKNNGNADKNCSSGYNKTDIPQVECKPVTPNACYVCKDDKNVFAWKNNGNADNSCSSGYNKTDIPQVECKPIDNPKTGNIAIFLVWVLGIGCLAYSLYYFKNTKLDN